MDIIEKFLRWKNDNIDKYTQIKKMVIVQFIFSVLLYIVLISNQLTNHYDGLWSGNYYKAGIWELSIGRWFWLYIDRLRMGISSEPATSCLTLLLIITGNILIFDIFGQIGKKTAYLAGMIILSSTTICNYLSYRYMSPTFGTSFLLSIIAAWILIKKTGWTGAAASAAATVLGLGSYQANLACTCVILIFVFIKMIAGGVEYKNIINFVLRSFIATVTGCIVYKIAWSLHLNILNVSPASAKGADSISIKDMIICFPQNIVKSYKTFISYFFKNEIKHNILQAFGFFYIVFAVVTIILVIGIIKVAKKSFARALLIIVSFAILPMACNISLFIATKAGNVMIQMTAGMAILLPVVLCFINNLREMKKVTCTRNLKFIAVLYMVVFALVLYGNVYMTAIDQEAMYEGKNSTETLVHEVVSELREKQMLSTDKYYLFNGCPSNNPLFRGTEFWSMANSYARYGEFWTSTDCLRMAYDGVLRNIGVNIKYATDDVAIQLRGREDVQNMPVFPLEGSIQEIDGYIVVKIS